MTTRVTVLVPGLDGPATRGAGSALDAAGALLADATLPGFSTLLSGADLAASPLAGATLAQLGTAALNAPGAGGAGLPAAALSRLAFPEVVPGDAARSGVWLRADPVHLRPDMGKLVVFPPEVLSLTLDQASRIADWLQAEPLFPGPALTLLTAHAWVCPADPAPAMRSVSPQEAYGEDAQSVIAEGGDAARWHARLNEIQMLLHACPVNEEREQDGLAAVNSLWFWGEGAIPDGAGPRADFDSVHADDPVIRGAARLAGVALSPGAAVDGLGAGHHLLAVPELELPARAQDPEAWREALQRVDALWLEPLARALHAGRLQAVDLHAVGTLIRARRPRLWQRWRRPASAVQSLARLRQAVAR